MDTERLLQEVAAYNAARIPASPQRQTARGAQINLLYEKAFYLPANRRRCVALTPVVNATPTREHQRTETSSIRFCAAPKRVLYSLVSFGLFTDCTLENMA